MDAARFIKEMIPSLDDECRPSEYEAAHVPGEIEDGA